MKFPPEFKTHIDTEIREYKYEETNSDEITVKGNQIIKNLDLNKVWTDDNQCKLTERNYQHLNNEDFDINDADFRKYVETIEEENEPESNLSTLMNDSIHEIDVMGSHYEDSDQMYINNMQLKEDQYITCKAGDKIPLRGEMNSTMKNFSQGNSSSKKKSADTMKTTAKFANICDPRLSEFNFIDLVLENEKDPKKLISKYYEFIFFNRNIF